MPFLKAMARGSPRSRPASCGRIRVPGAVGFSEFRMRTGMPALDRGLDRRGVQDLGAEVGELGRLVEADLGDHAGARARRAGRRSSCRPRRSRSGSPRAARTRAEDRGRPVGAAAAEGGGDALAGGADEAAAGRGTLPVVDEGRDRARGRAPASRPCGAAARPKVSSVTMTLRASTACAGRPSRVQRGRHDLGREPLAHARRSRPASAAVSSPR